MSFITTPGSMVKGTEEVISFNKESFLFQVAISDPFFANERNWKRVALVFEDAAGKQRQYAILSDGWSKAKFQPSETSRTGTWALKEIHMYDHHMGFYKIERAELPTPTDFDIEATRIVAPSATITSFEQAVEKNSDPGFDEASLTASGWSKIVSQGSDAFLEGGQLKLETDFATINTIKVEKSFSLEDGERYTLKLKPVLKDDGSYQESSTVREPASGTYFSNTTNPQYFYFTSTSQGAEVRWNDQAISGSESSSGIFVGSDGWTYYRGAYVEEFNYQGDIFRWYRIHRSKTVTTTVTGSINDLLVKVLDSQSNVITQQSYSSASGVDESIEFIAKGSTKIEISTTGQGGFWKVDDVSIKKAPDAITLSAADVDHYKVGYKVKLWDVAANAFLTSDVYEIMDIDGTKVTLDKEIVGDYVGKTLILKFPSYDESSGAQKGLYQYVGKGY